MKRRLALLTVAILGTVSAFAIGSPKIASANGCTNLNNFTRTAQAGHFPYGSGQVYVYLEEWVNHSGICINNTLVGMEWTSSDNDMDNTNSAVTLEDWPGVNTNPVYYQSGFGGITPAGAQNHGAYYSPFYNGNGPDGQECNPAVAIVDNYGYGSFLTNQGAGGNQYWTMPLLSHNPGGDPAC